MVRKNAKDHRAKKNPKSSEAYREERHDNNSKRPKQICIEGQWTRTDAGLPTNKEN